MVVNMNTLKAHHLMSAMLHLCSTWTVLKIQARLGRYLISLLSVLLLSKGACEPRYTITVACRAKECELCHNEALAFC